MGWLCVSGPIVRFGGEIIGKGEEEELVTSGPGVVGGGETRSMESQGKWRSLVSADWVMVPLGRVWMQSVSKPRRQR